MVKIAIVGPQENRWTNEQKIKAKLVIAKILLHTDMLISGGCPKGGVDVWAEEIADINHIPKTIFKPEVNQWNDKLSCPSNATIGTFITLIGYKSRNLMIAKECDILFCIVPYLYTYDKKKLCWVHTKENHNPHPWNGGCWTLKKAQELGKEVHLIVIE